jgi:site-specific DNA-methyltransferase (adenine-specific)
MKDFKDNSVDAIVTDPPYGLSFMGKKWDYSVPNVEVWSEALRVLKPGGYLLAFAGTRTQHRMACNIEDVGFEIRDMISWVYGCLSDDTEILTTNGWQKYDTLFAGSMVMCYNADDRAFEFMSTDEVIVYDYEDTAYRIQSDSTDQIVSKNHRCIVERGGREVFRYAETLERQEVVPILERVQNLSETVCDKDERASGQKQVLFSGLPEFGNIKSKQWDSTAEAQAGEHDLSGMWKRILATQSTCNQSKKPDLQQSMQWSTEGTRFETTRQQGKSKLDAGKRGGFSREDERRNKPKLEGGSDLQNPEGELSELFYKVREMPGTIQNNGMQRRLRDGASVKYSQASGVCVETFGNCSPHRPQSGKQRNKQFDAIQNKLGTQKIRSGRYQHKTTLATVTPIEYKGKMWCIRVPTGAFIARRNGRIFITGNSGFPKSHNIGVAVDKLQGNEREIVRIRTDGNKGGGANTYDDDNYVRDTPFEETKGTSEWEGWGTALKPSFEPITVARKPLSEKTVAKNVLKWGTGGINIDACRIEAEEEITNHSRSKDSAISKGKYGDSSEQKTHQTTGQKLGRFPTNLIHDGSDEVTKLFPNSKSTGGRTVKRKGGGNVGSGKTSEVMSLPIDPGYGDNGSASRFFYCAKASKKERNGWADSEITNDHPTVKPIALMEYLIKLVSREGALVLDPFMGSGTTGIACKKLNRNFIGIELDKDYFEIAKKRIESPTSVSLF